MCFIQNVFDVFPNDERMKFETLRSFTLLIQVSHEKPARRLVDQRGRRSRTLYRKLNKCKCSVHKSALTYKEIIFSTFSNQ